MGWLDGAKGNPRGLIKTQDDKHPFLNKGNTFMLFHVPNRPFDTITTPNGEAHFRPLNRLPFENGSEVAIPLETHFKWGAQPLDPTSKH